MGNFCGSKDFIRLTKLISKFQDKNGTKLKAKLKEFIAKTRHAKHANYINTYMARINVLCVRLISVTSQDPRTTVILWDNGASFGLTPFKNRLC